MFKNVLVLVAFMGALFITMSAHRPYVAAGSDAQAGVAECKARCMQKKAECVRNCHADAKCTEACDPAQISCNKDCEAR